MHFRSYGKSMLRTRISYGYVVRFDISMKFLNILLISQYLISINRRSVWVLDALKTRDKEINRPKLTCQRNSCFPTVLFVFGIVEIEEFRLRRSLDIRIKMNDHNLL